jgi:putative redox protein
MAKEYVSVHMGDGFKTTASTRDFEWHADLPEENGGTNTAPNPEELLLGALGSCMAQTAKLYAQRKGWQIDAITINLSFERLKAEDYPAYDGDARFVHEVTEEIIIEGPLSEDQHQRVLEIMGKCPVRRIISNPVFFAESIVEEA